MCQQRSSRPYHLLIGNIIKLNEILVAFDYPQANRPRLYEAEPGPVEGDGLLSSRYYACASYFTGFSCYLGNECIPATPSIWRSL